MRSTLPLVLLSLCVACSGSTHNSEPDTPDGSISSQVDAGSGPAAPDAALEQPLGPIPTLDRFVVLGDSVAGGDYPKLLMNNPGSEFPQFVGRDLSTRYPGIDLLDHAHGGSTIEDVLAEIDDLSAYPGSVLVSISVGGNDFKDNPSEVINPTASQARADQFETDLDEVVSRLEALYTGPLYIVLGNIHDPADGDGQIFDKAGLEGNVCDMLMFVETLGQGMTVMENVQYWNTKHRAAATGHATVTLFDMHDLFLGHGLNATDPSSVSYHADDPTTWLLNDCVHPNRLGHHSIRAELWSMIAGE
jgi:lysophospholipase L1-like esterase